MCSGESGAGKTESTKLIIKQLVELCRGNTQLERQILQVSALLAYLVDTHALMTHSRTHVRMYLNTLHDSYP